MDGRDDGSGAVRAVILDRDGVLTTIDRGCLLRQVLARVPLSEAALAERWQVWLAGRPLVGVDDEDAARRGFLRHLGGELGLADQARAELEAIDYAPCVRAYPDARPALLAARGRGLRIGVLTNNSAALSPTRMLALAGLDELVDVALSAQQAGARKPTPAAYAAIVAALAVPASACLFFDDTPAAVAGARAVGMRAWQVDRRRDAHAIEHGVVRDLSALTILLDRSAPEQAIP